MFFALAFCSASELNSPWFIPENERALDASLRSGMLDSLDWESLKGLYAQPIDVPRGELAYLGLLYSNLAESVPSLQQLSKYLPWDSAGINLFFADYPYLEKFLPVLSFKGKLEQTVTTEFTIGADGFSDVISRYGKISYYPNRGLRFDGRLVITNNSLRWVRRTATVSNSYLTLEAGSIKPFIDDGLFTGYFPLVTIDSNDLIQNWVYGVTRGWNGINATIKAGLNGVEFFHHDRPSEQWSGASGIISKNGFFIQTGSSYLVTVDSAPTSLLHFKTGYSKKRVAVSLASGISMDAYSEIPFIVRCRFHINDDFIRTSMLYMPENVVATRSAFLHSLEIRTDAASVERDDITRFTTDWNHALGKNLRIETAFSSDFTSNTLYRINNALSIRGGIGVQYFVTAGILNDCLIDKELFQTAQQIRFKKRYCTFELYQNSQLNTNHMEQYTSRLNCRVDWNSIVSSEIGTGLNWEQFNNKFSVWGSLQSRYILFTGNYMELEVSSRNVLTPAELHYEVVAFFSF